MLRHLFRSALVPVILFFASPAFAQTVSNAPGRYGLKDPLGGLDIPTLIGAFIRYALGIVGALFLLYFIYAGFLWMTAGGEAERVKKSKHTMINAVLGIVVIMLSYAIISFVITLANKAQGH